MSNKLTRSVSVVGLGYVGLPVAVAFGKIARTVGFDINQKRLAALRGGLDVNGEVESSELRSADVVFTDSIEELKRADFHIVTVPTPIDEARRPDLRPMYAATETVGRALKKGDIVVYESTVYPGVTEEECLPILERVSGLKGGVDFKVGYSPERINPGDREHRFETITKVVSGMDAETLEIVAQTYGAVVKAGVYRAASVKVAEAAKVIENTQRDLNISLMNELAIVFERMGIATSDVLAAAGTKWNFLKFAPGLVGGHCIGVDPYYLTHKSEMLGYQPQVILAGRRINDGMGRYVARKTVKEIIHSGQQVLGSTVTILGLTFKENCPDIRNTRVTDIIRELEEFGVTPQVHDPLADPEDARREYGIELRAFEDLQPASAVVIAVAHDIFKKLASAELKKLTREPSVVVDVKSAFHPDDLKRHGIRSWRL
jgi:UDP-N-acetyl-D-galactosamine dehydrogenase